MSGPLGVSARARTVGASATLAINEAVARRRAAGEDIIHLGFGEASFPLHPTLREALARAATRTGYAPVQGILELRAAIAGYLGRTCGLTYHAEQIIVAPGSKPLLYALLSALEGDVLTPAPSWVSYEPMARLGSKRVTLVATDPNDHHRLTPDALAEALARGRADGADPRILMVNSPSNPTGRMFDRADLEAITGWARREGLTLISDEIYAELAHGWRAHISPARFYPEGTIVTGGLSKAFSAGGWRLGYAALPPTPAGAAVMTALRSLASEIWSAASTPIQEAAITAFNPDPEIEAYVRRSAHAHGYITGRLHEAFTRLDMLCPRPAGGFYLYPDFEPWRTPLARRGVTTSAELANYLLEEWGVATLPGSAFLDPPEALRLRLATSMLCEPDGAHSPKERESALFSALAQFDQPEPPGGLFPALARATARLTDVVRALEA